MENTKQFYSLQKSWYEKLAKDGFEDIETLMKDGTSGSYTKNAVGVNGQKYSAEELGEAQDYFLMAGKFLFEHEFKSDLEREIWERFSNGESIRETMRNLPEKISFRQCRNIVNRLKLDLNDYIAKEVDDKFRDG